MTAKWYIGIVQSRTPISGSQQARNAAVFGAGDVLQNKVLGNGPDEGFASLLTYLSQQFWQSGGNGSLKNPQVSSALKPPH